MSKRIHCSYDPRLPDIWKLESHYVRDEIVVPKGFRWDGASTPKLARSFLPRWGEYSGAALVHDYIYSKECQLVITRDKADRLLLAYMEQDGVSYIQRKLMYYSVRLFGSKFWKKG